MGYRQIQALNLLRGLIRKWETQLRHNISNNLLPPPPAMFSQEHRTSWQLNTPVLKKFHNGKFGCGNSLFLIHLLHVLLTKQSYFWFHSEQRKCQLSRSSLKSCWRIIMKWIRAMVFILLATLIAVPLWLPILWDFNLYCMGALSWRSGKGCSLFRLHEGSFSALTSACQHRVMC